MNADVSWNVHYNWMSGKPRLVTLGVAGTYILVTEEIRFLGNFAAAYPSLYNLLLTLDDGSSANKSPLEQWRDIWKRVKHLTLHPYQSDAFILVDDTNKLHCHDPPDRNGTDMHFDMRAIARTLLDPSKALHYGERAEKSKIALRNKSPEERRLIAERSRRARRAAEARRKETEAFINAVKRNHEEAKRRAAADAEREKKKKEKESKRQREEDEQEAPRKRPNNAARSIADAPRLLHAWLDTVKLGLDDVETMTVFPFAPVVGIPCAIEKCCADKKELGTASPGVCVHELEKLLKAHGGYSHAWLKVKRIQWHPDAKWVRAPAEVREVFRERATVMFAMFGTLMDKLKK